MKKLHFMTLCLAMVMASLCFVSCGDDDDYPEIHPGTGSKALLGTWQVLPGFTTWDETNYVMFCSDGTGYDIEVEETIDVDKFEYEYQPATRKLLVREIDDNEVEQFEVVKLEGDKLIIREDDGDTFQAARCRQPPYTVKQLEQLWQMQR